MTQVRRIIDYMTEHGSITPQEAQRHFGCMRLAARIADIRQMGIPVDMHKVKGKNMFGEDVYFASYSLGEVK